MKSILYIAVIVGVVTCSFWDLFPKGSYYIGDALFKILLCTYLFIKDRNSFVCFLLVSYSINNMLDELFFTPGKRELNEYIFAITVPVIWYLKNRSYARENTSE